MNTGGSDTTRRDLLKIATTALLSASGLLGAAWLWRTFTYDRSTPAAESFPAGSAADHPQGSRTRLEEIPAVLVHGEEGFRALSLVCPHLGCTLQDDSEGFHCPCHGSRFDPDGRLLRGPAGQSMTELRLEIDPEGMLTVHLDHP